MQKKIMKDFGLFAHYNTGKQNEKNKKNPILFNLFISTDKVISILSQDVLLTLW